MSPVEIALIVLVGLIVLGVLWFIGIYNSLVRGRNGNSGSEKGSTCNVNRRDCQSSLSVGLKSPKLRCCWKTAIYW